MARRIAWFAGALGLGIGVARVVARRREAAPEGPRRSAPVSTRNAVDRNVAVARLGVRAGSAWAVHRGRRVFASAERREELAAEMQLRTAEQVAAALGEMKGAFMKLGQMLSYVDEGLPEPVRAAMAQLQQDAPPMAPELAAEVVERELGAGPDSVFAEWDPVPIAAASIGQVHRAITHDGTAVAVKVQYPGVDEAIASDLRTTDLLTQSMRLMFPNVDPGPIAGEIRARLTEELDYAHEASNQQEFADWYRGHPFIHVPDVVAGLSTRRVLTTELAEGVRYAELDRWPQEERDLAAEAIYRFVFRSLYRMHVFNGDPHPGNYLFRPGGQVTFLDFGLVKRFTPSEIRLFERLVETMCLSPDPEAFLATLVEADVLRAGDPVDPRDAYEAMAPYYDMVLRDESRTFTPEYASAVVRKLFDAESPITRHTSGGGSVFVFINRINLGLFAILGHLHATRNWRRIAEELWPMTDGAPSTELGHKEAAWLASR